MRSATNHMFFSLVAGWLLWVAYAFVSWLTKGVICWGYLLGNMRERLHNIDCFPASSSKSSGTNPCWTSVSLEFPSGEPSKKQGKGEGIFGTCLERQIYEVFCLLMIQVDGSTFSWNSLKSTRELMKLFFLGHQKHDFSRDCSLIFFGRKFSRGGGKNSSPPSKGGGGCWNIESLAAFFTQNLLQDPWDFRFKPEVLPMGESLQPTKTGSNVSTRVHRK